jgi:hypothetical protein
MKLPRYLSSGTGMLQMVFAAAGCVEQELRKIRSALIAVYFDRVGGQAENSVSLRFLCDSWRKVRFVFGDFGREVRVGNGFAPGHFFTLFTLLCAETKSASSEKSLAPRRETAPSPFSHPGTSLHRRR